jgi:nucleoside-diphosphate-sugar epimerase
MSTPHALVTGGSGYVGPHVVRSLLARGYRVSTMTRPGGRSSTVEGSHQLSGDILSPDFDAQSLDARFDVVVHLAWRDGFTHNSPAHMGDLSAHYRFLTESVPRLADRLVALGTMHEVGYWHGAIDAGTPTNPTSQYGVAKDALRRSLPLALPESFSAAWARCYYILGDDRRNRSIFTRLLEAADAGKTDFPFTSGTNQYDFIDVAQLGDQIAALAGAWDVTGVVNTCSGHPRSLADQVEEFIAANDLGIRLNYGAFPDRPYDSPAVWGDASTIAGVMSRES